MRHSLTRWIIALVLIWSGVSSGSAVQATATAGPANTTDLSVTTASDPPLPLKIYLPSILSASDGLVRAPSTTTRPTSAWTPRTPLSTSGHPIGTESSSTAKRQMTCFPSKPAPATTGSTSMEKCYQEDSRRGTGHCRRQQNAKRIY
jgi:hypothetical protein